MFNDYVWKMYLDTNGKDTVEMFERNLNGELSSDYAESISELHKAYCASMIIVEELSDELKTTYDIAKEGVCAFDDGEYSIDTAMSFLFNDFMSEENATAQSVFDEFSGAMAYFTTLYAIELPELFVPYYFKYNFNIFEKLQANSKFPFLLFPLKKIMNAVSFITESYVKYCMISELSMICHRMSYVPFFMILRLNI